VNEPEIEQVTAREHWHANAEAWIAWSRSSPHDTYWYWRDAFFREMVPSPGARTLEIGCGEGRVTRDLAAQGHAVVAVDLVEKLIRAARDAATTGHFIVADAANLPFPNESFEVIVAHNSLMDVDALGTVIDEISRVLCPGGYLCASVVHPIFDAGHFEGSVQDGRFVIDNAYCLRRPFNAVYRRANLEMSFRGWSYSLEYYFRALEKAHLMVDKLREPLPPATPEPLQSGQRFDHIPPFLHFRARKLTPGL
jgi:ubiquinone/menaquinone biosynthesis C-methylase UbiE